MIDFYSPCFRFIYIYASIALFLCCYRIKIYIVFLYIIHETRNVCDNPRTLVLRGPVVTVRLSHTQALASTVVSTVNSDGYNCTVLQK